MRVLGISPLDKDATVSFLEDGHVVFACAEERLSRVKLQSGFPHRALRLGLQRTGWNPASIDAVAYAFFDGDGETRLMREAMDLDARVHRPRATAESLRALRTAEGNYVLDRSTPIPGLPSDESEFMPRKTWWKRLLYATTARSPRLDRLTHRRLFRQWFAEASADHYRWNCELNLGLAEYGLTAKLRRYHHHDTHAANAYFASGYDRALLVTLDGYGSGCCGGVYVGDGNGVRMLHRFAFPNSLGHFYEQVTSGLGFKPSRHEGKIVGLAAYGDAGHLARALLVTLDGYGSGCCGGVYVGDGEGVRMLHRFAFPNSLGHFYEQVTSGLGFKPSRHEGKIVGLAAYGDAGHLARALLERFECDNGDIRMRSALNAMLTRALADRFAKRDIAAAYQRVLEVVACRAIAYWQKRTGLSNVALSGGVHANVKLNQRIREIDGVESVFVYPNMGDGGCGTGAAMLAFDRSDFPVRPLADVYHGPDYSRAQIEAALRREKLAYERCDEIEERIAELLTKDCIVGRFNGRMEYGPRALGNRSILYPAGDPEVNQWLNQQLGRTEFMPFAPAALADAAPRLFRNLSGCGKTAEFMTITFDCTEEMKRKCPAAVHVDGTARPQLVSERTNPSFARILRGYEARTGVPAIINTSFNMHEEPIVCTPEDAVRAFLLGNIDYLAIGSYLAPHPRLRQNVEVRQKTRPVTRRPEAIAAH